MKTAPLVLAALLVSCSTSTNNPSVHEVVSKLDPQTRDMCSNDGKYCYLVTFKSPSEIKSIFPGKWSSDGKGERMVKFSDTTIRFKQASGIYANVDAMSVNVYDNSISYGESLMRLVQELEEIDSGKSY